MEIGIETIGKTPTITSSPTLSAPTSIEGKGISFSGQKSLLSFEQPIPSPLRIDSTLPTVNLTTLSTVPTLTEKDTQRLPPLPTDTDAVIPEMPPSTIQKQELHQILVTIERLLDADINSISTKEALIDLLEQKTNDIEQTLAALDNEIDEKAQSLEELIDEQPTEKEQLVPVIDTAVQTKRFRRLQTLFYLLNPKTEKTLNDFKQQTEDFLLSQPPKLKSPLIGDENDGTLILIARDIKDISLPIPLKAKEWSDWDEQMLRLLQMIVEKHPALKLDTPNKGITPALDSQVDEVFLYSAKQLLANVNYALVV